MKVTIETFLVEHEDISARVDLVNEIMSIETNDGDIDIPTGDDNIKELIKVLKMAQSFIENDSQIVIAETAGIE